MIIAGTGHRPDKLGNEYNMNRKEYGPICQAVDREIQEYLNTHKPDKVITGMALGFDMLLANAALYMDIPFDAYVPFLGQESKWPKESREHYNWLLQKAASVVIVCDGKFANWKFQKRNERMVDDCDILLALWNGTEGGTANCVEYAVEQNKPIIPIDYELIMSLKNK